MLEHLFWGLLGSELIVEMCEQIQFISASFMSTDFQRTFKYRADLPNRSCSLSVILTQGKFHVKQGHPSNEQEQNVWDQKGTWGHIIEFEFDSWHISGDG